MKKQLFVFGGVVIVLVAVIIGLAVRNSNLKQGEDSENVAQVVTPGESSGGTKSTNVVTPGTKAVPPAVTAYPPEYSEFQLTYQCTGHCKEVKSLIYEFNLDTPKVIKFNRVVFGTQRMSAGQSVTVTCNTYENTKTITPTKDTTNQWSTTSCSNISGTKVRMVVTVTGSGTGTVTPLFEKWQVVDVDANRLVKILQ